ncbi:MAG: hypothetical protein WBM51_11250, partial [Pseudolabrys sp.]
MCGFPFGLRWRLHVDISVRRWATAGAGTELSGHYRQGLIEKTDPNPMTGASYFADQAGLFLPDKKLNQIEISDAVRMVQTNTNGWAWQTCVRLNVDNKPGTYAVFITDGRAVLARAENPTDHCEAGQYAPLDV